MLIALIVSLLAGGCIVISRMINATLANEIGVLESTWFNYTFGLIASLAMLFAFKEPFMNHLSLSSLISQVPWWAFFGGIVGIAVVMLSNVTSLKMPAFTLTLIIFLGQLIAGLMIDFILTHEFSMYRASGGLLVFLGLVVHVRSEKKNSK